MQPFRFEPGTGGSGSTNAIPWSDAVMTVALSAGAAETITKPTGARIVVFVSNVDFCASVTGTAVWPSADDATGGASILNPVARSVTDFASISVVSNAPGIVQAAFYS